jgi:hypothetical protein
MVTDFQRTTIPTAVSVLADEPTQTDATDMVIQNGEEFEDGGGI